MMGLEQTKLGTIGGRGEGRGGGQENVSGWMRH
jgi:hypothetical protein